jgi:hypothetical protein
MANMADGFVQVATDGAGKKIDNTEVTRSDTAVVVERQRVEARDDSDEVLSTQALADKLDEIRDLLFDLKTMLETNNAIWLTIAKG